MEVSRPQSIDQAALFPGADTGMWRRTMDRLRRGEARWDIIVLGGLLTLAIFVIDLVLPLGIAGGVPYIAPVLMAMWLPERRLIIVVATVCTILAGAGLWLSPLGADLGVAIPNRLLAIVAIWAVGLLAFQRKSFELALAESEATNRSMLATTADGILTLDDTGRILSANTAAERMFGYSGHGLIGRHFTLLLDSEHRTLFLQNQLRYLRPDAGESVVTHELAGQHKQGQTFPIEVVLAPVAHEDGVNYTVTIRDIAERRFLEQYLLRTSAEERRAFGHTLHEELGQAITGLHLISRELAHRLQSRDYAEAKEVSELAALLHEIDAQAIELFQTIAPVDASGGLPDALSQLIHRVAELRGVECMVQDGNGVAPIDEFTAAQVYHIVRELVNGYLAAGDVDGIELRIGTNGDARSLAVCLHGTKGHDDEDAAALIRRLAYRAKLIGGRLESCAPAAGELTVTCSWPEAATHQPAIARGA